MWQPNRAQWRIIWMVAVLLIVAWPPREGVSLALKAVRWAADPQHTLPVLPEPLPMGLGDDGDAVAAHDQQWAEYYEFEERSAMNRLRLQLRDVQEPLDPGTQRQLLVGVAVLAALGVWKLNTGTRRGHEDTKTPRSHEGTKG